MLVTKGLSGSASMRLAKVTAVSSGWPYCHQPLADGFEDCDRAESSLPHLLHLTCFLLASCLGMEKLFCPEASSSSFCRLFPSPTPVSCCSWGRQHFLIWKGKGHGHGKNKTKTLILMFLVVERSTFLNETACDFIHLELKTFMACCWHFCSSLSYIRKDF